MLRLITGLVSRLPLSWIRALGRWLGWLTFNLLRIRRRTAVAHIGQALEMDPGASMALAREAYGQLGQGAMEFLQIGGLTPSSATALLGEEGLTKLRRVLDQGRGMLALSAHLGNWDLLACAAACAGLPVNVLTRQIKTSWINNFWMEQRRGCGVRLLPAAGSAVKIRRALQCNEIVALVLDQHEPGGVAVPFFGRPAATSDTLARLARAFGSPVVPVFLLRTRDGFRLEVDDPLALDFTEDREEDLLQITCRCTQVLEEKIRRYPAQWLWLHRRWKNAHQ